MLSTLRWRDEKGNAELRPAPPSPTKGTIEQRIADVPSRALGTATAPSAGIRVDSRIRVGRFGEAGFFVYRWLARSASSRFLAKSPWHGERCRGGIFAPIRPLVNRPKPESLSNLFFQDGVCHRTPHDAKAWGRRKGKGSPGADAVIHIRASKKGTPNPYAAPRTSAKRQNRRTQDRRSLLAGNGAALLLFFKGLK